MGVPSAPSFPLSLSVVEEVGAATEGKGGGEAVGREERTQPCLLAHCSPLGGAERSFQSLWSLRWKSRHRSYWHEAMFITEVPREFFILWGRFYLGW